LLSRNEYSGAYIGTIFIGDPLINNYPVRVVFDTGS
jgi:hypothetical protein